MATASGSNQQKILEALKTRAMTYIELKEASGLRVDYRSAFDGLVRRNRIHKTITGRWASDETPPETETDLHAHIEAQSQQIQDLLSVSLARSVEIETLRATLRTIISLWCLSQGTERSVAKTRLETALRELSRGFEFEDEEETEKAVS